MGVIGSLRSLTLSLVAEMRIASDCVGLRVNLLLAALGDRW